MNNTKIFSAARDVETLRAHFALRVALHLNEAAIKSPHEVQERLRFAREQALQRARESRATAASPFAVPLAISAGALSLGNGGNRSPWWVRLASVLPLVVLLAGLTLIQDHFSRVQIEAAAEIDAALLADTVPPVAYSDPGFAEFLKYPLE